MVGFFKALTGELERELLSRELHRSELMSRPISVSMASIMAL